LHVAALTHSLRTTVEQLAATNRGKYLVEVAVRQPKDARPNAAVVRVAGMDCSCAWGLVGYLPGTFPHDRGAQTGTTALNPSSVFLLAEAGGR
jgi:hypothetical protein